MLGQHVLPYLVNEVRFPTVLRNVLSFGADWTFLFYVSMSCSLFLCGHLSPCFIGCFIFDFGSYPKQLRKRKNLFFHALAENRDEPLFRIFQLASSKWTLGIPRKPTARKTILKFPSGKRRPPPACTGGAGHILRSQTGNFAELCGDC